MDVAVIVVASESRDCVTVENQLEDMKDSLDMLIQKGRALVKLQK